ncbi:probable arginine--tRNA ligase, mitochondrial isoform X2 [Artemia franciscana]|uniref:probable arginine--tRNA ligase, mitochondrial isoform X2 n=1 Tax=Artemia franciscana TaxID=6661 RepID=UPI0032DB1C05
MANRFRTEISNIIKKIFPSWEIPAYNIKVIRERNSGRICFKLDEVPLNIKSIEVENGLSSDFCKAKLTPEKNSLSCEVVVDKKWIVRHLLEELEDKLFQDSRLFSVIEKQRVVIDYSSPNIAKPFHVGHLRSSIIGNFLKKLLETVGHQTVGLNYLGDWGTQFGILKHGLDQKWIPFDDIQSSPIRKLFEIYVKANIQAKEDPVFMEKSLEKFRFLENGDENTVKDWSIIKDYTVAELQRIYARLNIKFDVYDWESMYGRKRIQSIVDLLTSKGLLTPSPEGKLIYKFKERPITLVKSDGTTLYLTRDIAAALDRRERFQADCFLYVVDNAQSDHFQALFSIMKDVKMEGATHMKHVKFGRIQGMSTRKGNVVFLDDVLDEAKERMAQQRKRSVTTRTTLNEDYVNDVLGISAVLVNDLKQRRQKDYVFNWEKILASQGDTGVKLQYTHSRLCSLEKKSGVASIPPSSEINVSCLIEEEAINLVRHLLRFEEIILRCHDELEPCILVAYLFQLWSVKNYRTAKELKIRGLVERLMFGFHQRGRFSLTMVEDTLDILASQVGEK